VSREDLTDFLQDWAYVPGRVNARKIAGRDGRAKLQIRIDLGVFQMETDGRPDGQRPHGFESLLAYEQDRLRRYVEIQGGPLGFVLTAEECKALREEAVQYYHRYVGLMALGDYAGVIRDTQRNLELFDLCREYAATAADRQMLEQFRPFVITTQARAKAEASIAAGHPKHALAAIDEGLRSLRSVFEDANMPESFEQASEVQLLRGMRDALVPKLPMSQRVELEERLRAAIDAENFELAAILRDELRMLEG
jgi:hypothetical protein